MTTKFIKAASFILSLVLFTSVVQAQIEELEPVIEIETTETNTQVTDQDYKDTWRTPFVSDEMTIDPEQNMKWKQGEYKYNSQPRDSWEVGLHAGHFFIDGDIDRAIPGGWGAGVHLRKAINLSLIHI